MDLENLGNHSKEFIKNEKFGDTSERISQKYGEKKEKFCLEVLPKK